MRFTKNNVALQLCYICIMDIMVTLCSGSSFLYSADILRFSKGAIYKLMWWMSGGEWIEEFSPQTLSVVLCRLVTCTLSSFLHQHNPSRGPPFCLMDKCTHTKVDHMERLKTYTHDIHALTHLRGGDTCTDAYTLWHLSSCCALEDML